MAACPATDVVWRQLSDDLRRFIRRRVADEHVADDLLQETFLRIHRRIESLEDRDRLAAWVYRIARNVVHDHYRQSADGPVALADADPADDPADRLGCLGPQASVWLDELIRQLPEKYREAVWLSEIDGLTQQQVADRLGITLSGAKSRIQRGRALLRPVLDSCCRFEFDHRGNVTDYDPKPDRTICRNCDETGGASC